MSKEIEIKGPIENLYEAIPEDGEVVLEGVLAMYLGVVMEKDGGELE